MKVPISWLKDYVDIKLAPQALAERLKNAKLRGNLCIEDTDYRATLGLV